MLTGYLAVQITMTLCCSKLGVSQFLSSATRCHTSDAVRHLAALPSWRIFGSPASTVWYTDYRVLNGDRLATDLSLLGWLAPCAASFHHSFVLLRRSDDKIQMRCQGYSWPYWCGAFVWNETGRQNDRLSRGCVCRHASYTRRWQVCSDGLLGHI